MKNWSKAGSVSIVAAICILVGAAGSQAADSGVDELLSRSSDSLQEIGLVNSGDSFYENFISGRLDVGLRISHFDFTESKKRIYGEDGSFRGGFTEGISTDELIEDQNYMPTLYMRYWILKYFGVEVGWERIAAGTSTYWDGHSDGDLEAAGPTFMLVASTDRQKRVYGYAGIGLARLMADFDDDPWKEGIHNIKVKDTTATLFEFGAAVDLGRNIKLDLTTRHMQADIDSHFWLQYGDLHINDHYWKFPVDNWATQIGIIYSF